MLQLLLLAGVARAALPAGALRPWRYEDHASQPAIAAPCATGGGEIKAAGGHVICRHSSLSPHTANLVCM
jgi:hypothetical protein